MATLWERAQNLVDDHQDRQAVAAVASQKTQALTQTRDDLLSKALELQQNYRDELAGAASPDARKAIHAAYEARLEGINDAFTVLRQAEPGITTQLSTDQFRQEAERYAEQQARFRSYEQSQATPPNEHGRSRQFLGDRGLSR